LCWGGWSPLLVAGAVAFVMRPGGPGGRLLGRERGRRRRREEEFLAGVRETPPIRLPGAAAIFTAASTGIPLGLTHHLRHNKVLYERVLLISSLTRRVASGTRETHQARSGRWRDHPRNLPFRLHGIAGHNGGAEAW